MRFLLTLLLSVAAQAQSRFLEFVTFPGGNVDVNLYENCTDVTPYPEPRAPLGWGWRFKGDWITEVNNLPDGTRVFISLYGQYDRYVGRDAFVYGSGTGVCTDIAPIYL